MADMRPAAARTAGGIARPEVISLGETGYAECWSRMREFTDGRDGSSRDEVWLTTHPPVYTLGQSGKDGHVLRDNGIEVVRTDRGGQVTYHGPGQAVAYVLFDLVRAGTGIRTLVRAIENATVDFLAGFGIEGARRDGMPGVYVGGAKIAAIGLRVRRGRSYHGASLNVDVDLAPFSDIDTCGFRDLADTSMRELGHEEGCDEVAPKWGEAIADALAPRC